MAPYPTDPSFPLRSEKYWFRSIILANIGYGINFALYLVCANLLISRISGPPGVRTQRRWDILSLVYATFMFACCTISIVTESVTGEEAYVGSPSLHPEGPATYLFNHTFPHVTLLKAAYISFFLCYWGENGLMAWRCFVIYKSVDGGVTCMGIPRRVLWMVLPGILAIASMGTGIIWVLQAVAPMYLAKSIQLMKWPAIWGSFAIAMKWTLTGMIVIRLLMHRAYIQRDIGDRYATKYAGIVSMLVEALTFMSSFSVIFLIAYIVESPVMVMVPFVLTQAQVITALSIVYRIISGQCWKPHSTPSLISLPVVGEEEHRLS